MAPSQYYSTIRTLTIAFYTALSLLSIPLGASENIGGSLRNKMASLDVALTSCGSIWYQRAGLQILETEQAMRGGYSFDSACKAHDACYGDCKTTRTDCDKNLLVDAQKVCDSAKNSRSCLADAQIFFKAVSEKGETPFQSARMNCSTATTEAATESLSAVASPFDGEWYSKKYRYGFRLVGDVGLSNSPKFKKVGDEILRIDATSGSTFRGHQMHQDGSWSPVSGELMPDGRLQMKYKRNRWMMDRVEVSGSESAKAPPNSSSSTRISQVDPSYSAAAAAVASGNLLASQFPDLRKLLTQIASRPDVPATEATLDSAMELVVAYLLSWETLGGEWEALGVGPDDLAEYIAKTPDAFVKTFASQVGENIATSLAADAAGALVADVLFASPPFNGWPEEWKVPSRAFVAAVVSEGIGVAKSARAAAQGDPTVLVAPMLARLRDIQEIYVSTSALGRIQSHGLVQVSLGLEIMADLVTRYPSAKHDELADEELAALNDRLPKMVGPDDTAETKAVFLAGYEALIDAKHGDLAAARIKIQEIKKLGAASNGPTPLSAEGPIDLLLKLIQGADAPGEAATILLSTTSLRDLENVGSVSLGEARGAQCVPAKTDSCGLCEPAAAGLYPPDEGKSLRYEWTGACVNDSIDGYGTLTVFADGIDRFELQAAERSGLFFRSGAPILALPNNAVDVRLASGSAIAEPNACPTLRRIRIWAIVESRLQLQVRALADHVRGAALKRALKDCPSLKGAPFEMRIIERESIDRNGGFQKVAALVESGAGFLSVNCDGSALSIDAQCDRKNRNEIYRDHVNDLRRRHNVKLTAEKERARQSAQAAQQRVLDAQIKAAQLQLEAEVSALTSRAERLLDERTGTIAELATALQIDELRTLKQLERGLQLDLEPSRGARTMQHDGQKYYGVTYQSSSLIADAITRFRQQQLKQNFSWNNWFDQTSSVGTAKALELTCLFEDIDDIPKRQRRVDTELQSFNSSGSTTTIFLECD